MITCFIYTPGGKTVELETEIVSIGASDGRRGIIPGHMPICFPRVAFYDYGQRSTETLRSRRGDPLL